MCHAKPGSRCGNHLQANYEKARSELREAHEYVQELKAYGNMPDDTIHKARAAEESARQKVLILDRERLESDEGVAKLSEAARTSRGDNVSLLTSSYIRNQVRHRYDGSAYQIKKSGDKSLLGQTTTGAVYLNGATHTIEKNADGTIRYTIRDSDLIDDRSGHRHNVTTIEQHDFVPSQVRGTNMVLGTSVITSTTSNADGSGNTSAYISPRGTACDSITIEHSNGFGGREALKRPIKASTDVVISGKKLTKPDVTVHGWKFEDDESRIVAVRALEEAGFGKVSFSSEL